MDSIKGFFIMPRHTHSTILKEKISAHSKVLFLYIYFSEYPFSLRRSSWKICADLKISKGCLLNSSRELSELGIINITREKDEYGCFMENMYSIL